MDFKNLKEKALKLTNKALEKTKEIQKNIIIKSADKLVNSSFNIKNIEDLANCLEKNKKVIIVFGDSKSDFYKKYLLRFPVILTKGWVANYKLRLCDTNIKDLKLPNYTIKKSPCLIIFKDGKVDKTCDNIEKIEKIIKDFSIDIEKSLEQI